MKESLYYTASWSTIEEVEVLTFNKSSQSKDIDDEPDAVYLSAKYLLDHVERNTIVEIWKVSRITSLVCHHFYHLLNVTETAQFSLILIAGRWIPRDRRPDAAKECSYSGQRFHELDNNIDIDQESNEYRLTWLQLFANHEPANDINEEFVDEVLFYGKVWGLARTGVNKCMLHRDYEFIRLIEGYLEKICAKEDELAKEQEIATDQATIEHVEGNVISIANPRKVVTRGRPKSASHEKNVTTTQEKSIKKCGQYTCGFCKEPGHNIATCPYKARE
ncbi:3411_t:CDS:2 [Gigaspora rosea]|nr:3411_t:CDS:2 [Gigaspora rosea]